MFVGVFVFLFVCVCGSVTCEQRCVCFIWFCLFACFYVYVCVSVYISVYVQLHESACVVVCVCVCVSVFVSVCRRGGRWGVCGWVYFVATVQYFPYGISSGKPVTLTESHSPACNHMSKRTQREQEFFVVCV